MTDFVNARALSAQELQRISEAIAGNYCCYPDVGGVVSEDAGGASMTVDITDVLAGTVVIDGVELDTTATASSVTLDAADATSPRRDLIWVDASGTFGKTTGTAVAEDTVYDVDDEDTYVVVSPQLPDLNADEIALAEVYVGAGVTSVSDSDITDKRQITTHRVVARGVKAETETVNTSDTLQDDDTIQWTAAPNTIYWVEALLIITTGATPDIKLQWSVPSGTADTGYFTAVGVSGGGIVEDSATVIQGALTSTRFHIRGEIVIAATGGDVALQWAQNTSDASDTDVEQNSWFEVRRIGTYTAP
ncbi:MAG TPA: hypothetical protein VGA20_04325 [Gemmatimonadales bacterium]